MLVIGWKILKSQSEHSKFARNFLYMVMPVYYVSLFAKILIVVVTV